MESEALYQTSVGFLSEINYVGLPKLMPMRCYYGLH